MSPFGLPESIRVIEVGPRDGLQIEPTVLDVGTRRELVCRLLEAGLQHVEAASFVSERLVPQMAGAAMLIASLPAPADAIVSAMVLNERGARRALESGARHLRFGVAATESFNQRNQAAQVSDSLSDFRRSVGEAGESGARCSAIIMVAFGCPFEGSVPERAVVALAADLFSAGAQEVTLADTIGVAVPSQVEDLVGLLVQAHPGNGVGGHFHDTRNTGIANAVAAVRSGATHLDASVGGLGGCPFAPSASGNIATEDLVYCLESMGIATGVDLASLLKVATWLGVLLGRPMESALLRAGIPRFLDAWALQSISGVREVERI